MLRYCSLGQHVFDDGVKPHHIAKNLSRDEIISIVNAIPHEQVACKECWEKFTKQVSEAMKEIDNLDNE